MNKIAFMSGLAAAAAGVVLLTSRDITSPASSTDMNSDAGSDDAALEP
jgi:hypothetical protein